ncbi:MAG: hypothetical protein JKY59_00060 [Emcibacter sp.]|nr:hypothetical protein [Emcibacter sp.]
MGELELLTVGRVAMVRPKRFHLSGQRVGKSWFNERFMQELAKSTGQEVKTHTFGSGVKGRAFDYIVFDEANGGQE